jgi:hypothetical protein
MNIYLLTLNILILVISALLIRSYYLLKLKIAKQYIDSHLLLLTSHLHDASNLFNLIKFNLKNKPDIDDTKTFATGAQYHFRALFDELKAAHDKFQDKNLLDFQKKDLNIFFAMEEINLKDLIELELFQYFNAKSLKIIDYIKSDTANIDGNFSLLSKVLLNLIENALKYSSGKTVSLIIEEEELFYTIKIQSLDVAIPEDIKKNLLNLTNHNFGHGLSAVIDVLDYHQASININTAEQFGSSININFLKKQAIKTVKLSTYQREKSVWSPKINFNIFKYWKVLILLFLCLAVGFHYKSKLDNEISNYRTSIVTDFKESNCLRNFDNWTSNKMNLASLALFLDQKYLDNKINYDQLAKLSARFKFYPYYDYLLAEKSFQTKNFSSLIYYFSQALKKHLIAYFYQLEINNLFEDIHRYDSNIFSCADLKRQLALFVDPDNQR